MEKYDSLKKVGDNKIQKELTNLIKESLFPYKPLILGIYHTFIHKTSPINLILNYEIIYLTFSVASMSNQIAQETWSSLSAPLQLAQLYLLTTALGTISP